MFTWKHNLVAFASTVFLGFLLMASAPVSKAQQTGRCSFCEYVACEGQFSGKCFAGDVFETCSVEGSECPFECVTHVGCGGAITAGSTLTGCTGSPVTTKLVSAVPQQTESERRDAEDVKIRENLLKTGGAAVLVDPQLKGPVMMTQGRHTSKDMLASGQVLNMSDKAVTAVRVGWRVRTPNEPDEFQLGKWVTFAKPLAPEKFGDIPAQKVDTAPLSTPGTIIRFYIAQVQFQDGSQWKRPLEKPSADANQTSSAIAPLSRSHTGD